MGEIIPRTVVADWLTGVAGWGDAAAASGDTNLAPQVRQKRCAARTGLPQFEQNIPAGSGIGGGATTG